MKNRDYKNFSSGEIFHIYNRGNNKDKIFLDEQDYRAFLFRLGLVLGFNQEELNADETTKLPNSRVRISDAEKGNFKIHAFCLMPNHFHILIEQVKDMPVSKIISKLSTSYAMYFNKKHHRVGHVFQDQFKSVLVEDNPQLMWLFEYIHNNPVKDNLETKPENYKWSSYLEYIGKRKLPFVDTSLHVKDAP